MAVIEDMQTAPSVEDLEKIKDRRRRMAAVGVPLGTALGLIALWQIGVKLFGVPTYIAPAPSDVAGAFISKFPVLMENFWPTLFESVAGFAVGNIAAILIAVAFVHSRQVERAFFPIAVFINTIPILAIAPMVIAQLFEMRQVLGGRGMLC